MDIPIHIPACNLSLTETKLYPIVTYLKKKTECLYRNFVYCLSQKFLAVHVFNFYAVNLQTPGNHGKCLENLFKFGGGKKSSYCTYSFKSRIFLN